MASTGSELRRGDVLRRGGVLPRGDLLPRGDMSAALSTVSLYRRVPTCEETWEFSRFKRGEMERQSIPSVYVSKGLNTM